MYVEVLKEGTQDKMTLYLKKSILVFSVEKCSYLLER